MAHIFIKLRITEKKLELSTWLIARKIFKNNMNDSF